MVTTSPFQINKKEILFILLIFVLAFTVRAVYFNEYSHTNIYPFLTYSDSYSYFVWAKDIASGDLSGGEKAFMKWPLYAYLLGFLFSISRNGVLSAYMLQFLLGALNCVLIYLIASKVFNRAVGFIASLLCVWYGLFIFYEGLLIYTSLSLFLNSLLFLFILEIQDKPSRKNMFWIGIFLGICTITQANIVIFGLLAAMLILIRNKLSWAKLALSFISFLAGLCIVIGSVTLRNYLAEKDFVLIAGNIGFNFYIGNNSQATGTYSCPIYINLNQEDMFRDARVIAKMEMGRDLKTSEVSNLWFGKSIYFMRRHTTSYLKLLFKKIVYLLDPKEYVHDIEYDFIAGKIKIFKIMFMNLRFILPCGLLGMLLSLKRLKETALLFIVLIALSLSVTLFFIATRYRIAIVPFLAIFAAFGLFSVGKAMRQRNYPEFIGLCAALISILLLSNYDKVFAKKIYKDTRDLSSVFDDHFLKAIKYENDADYQNAIQELKLLNKIEPANPLILFRLGFVYLNLNDSKTAEKMFKEVVKVNPYSVSAYYNLGVLYNEQQRFIEAKDMLKKAVFLDPEHARAHFQLGFAYKSTQDFQNARKEFNLALKKTNRWLIQDREIIKNELNSLGK